MSRYQNVLASIFPPGNAKCRSYFNEDLHLRNHCREYYTFKNHPVFISILLFEEEVTSRGIILKLDENVMYYYFQVIGRKKKIQIFKRFMPPFYDRNLFKYCRSLQNKNGFKKLDGNKLGLFKKIGL